MDMDLKRALLTLDGVGTSLGSDTTAVANGTTTDTVIKLSGHYGTAEIQSRTGTSLAVKVYVGTADPDGVIVWTPSVSSGMGSSNTAADVAVVLSDTATAEKTVVRWDCAGFTHVKISRTAGSGTVMFTATPVGGVAGLSGALAILAAMGVNEDTAAANLEILMKNGTVRRDTPASSAGTSGDWATDNQSANGGQWTQEVAGVPGTNTAATPVAVSTTVLRVLGATSWTGATTNGARQRRMRITNHSATLYAYVAVIVVGGTLTGFISSSNYEDFISPGGVIDVNVPAGYDVCIVRASTSTDTCSAREYLQ